MSWRGGCPDVVVDALVWWWMSRRGGGCSGVVVDALVWWWMSRRGGGCSGVVVDALVWWWMLWCGGGCPGVVGMPWRDDPARGWGTTLLVPLWQSCVGVGVVPRHVAGEVVRCRIATVAPLFPAPDSVSVGPVRRVWGARSSAGSVFDCAGFVHGTSSSDVWQAWC